MSVKINLGMWNSVFAVPSQIVDEGLKFSDGVKLKVLLFVLRNSGRELSDEEISRATGVNVTDIPEAIDYWVSLGVFQKANNELVPENNTQNNSVKEQNTSYNSVTEINSTTTDNYNSNIENIQNSKEELSSQKPTEAEPKKPTFAVPRLQKPDYVFTAQRLAVDEELKILVDEAQSALGKVLSNADVSTLLMLKDTCGLPLDVILMLIHYCISIDKGNIRTIEKIGTGWANDGIFSVEAADNKIRQIKQSTTNFSIVKSVFGLVNVGSPTKKQLEFSDKWIGEWKFSPEMLRLAYEKCVDTKGEMKFSYIDAILKRWYSSNIKSKEDLAKSENTPKKLGGKRNTSYDIDELEKINTLDDF